MSCYHLFYLNWANFTTALLWENRREKTEISTQVGEKSLRAKHVIVKGWNVHTAGNLKLDSESLSL